MDKLYAKSAGGAACPKFNQSFIGDIAMSATYNDILENLNSLVLEQGFTKTSKTIQLLFDEGLLKERHARQAFQALRNIHKASCNYSLTLKLS